MSDDLVSGLPETCDYLLPAGASVWLHGHWLILREDVSITTPAASWAVMQACGLMDGAAPGAIR